MTGLVVASTASNAQSGAAAAWTITAPAGITIRRLDVQRAFQKWDRDWNVAVSTAEGATLDTCQIGGAQVSCSKGLDAGTQTAVYAELGTRSVSFGVQCLATHDCSGGTTPIQAWIAVYSAIVSVEDPAPPAIEPLSGALIAPGWHEGTERIDLAASDASGIKRLSLTAGDTTLYDQPQSCDFSRMQPCPASKRETLNVDTSRLPDGTHQLKAVATDAADQPAIATAVLKVDRHAPEKPTGLAVERNPDGTLALVWTNPDQGTAAPITGARYEVCDAAGSNCVAGELMGGRDIARVGSLAIPAGEHLVRVWLQDEAGHADPASAASLAVDPATISARRVVDTGPPVLLPDGPAPSSRLRITKARRTGTTLTLSGTIARAATATITAGVARTKTGKPVRQARTKARRGKWTLRIKLTPALRKTGTMYLSVRFAGQQSFRKTTLLRRLSKKPPRRGSTATEFSLETRSAR
jgi:hypothetical protein